MFGWDQVTARPCLDHSECRLLVISPGEDETAGLHRIRGEPSMSTSEAESGNTHQPTSRLLGLTWATGALAVFLWLLAIVGEVGDVVGHFPRGVVTLIAVMAGTPAGKTLPGSHRCGRRPPHTRAHPTAPPPLHGPVGASASP